MASFVLDVLVPARRTREAVRQIRSLALKDRDKKSIMAEWFQEHERATGDRTQRHEAYNELLGRDGNRRLGGGK